jgi:hypothetical protein
MAMVLPDKCPHCGLILLAGALMDAAAKADEFGPILGISLDANSAEAKAGYVGLGSVWLANVPEARVLYLCPRCKADPLVGARE